MLVLDILENSLSSARSMFIDVTNNGYTARVFVRQNSGSITFDRDTITFDNNTITFDQT